MTCWIEVGDTFVWQEDYKSAREGNTVNIKDIRVDEDGVPQVTINNYAGDGERITAEDIHIRVEEGLLAREE